MTYAGVRESFRTAISSLRVRKTRAFLTILGIVIGVATVIAIVSFIAGLDRTVEKEFASIGSSVLYVGKYPWIWTGKWYDYRRRPDITVDIADRLRERLTYAEYVVPEISDNGNVNYRSTTVEDVDIVGTSQDYIYIESAEVKIGRFLSEMENVRKRHSVVLGWGLFEAFGSDQKIVGRRVYIDGRPFKVVGVLARRGKSFGQERDNMAYVPINTFLKYARYKHKSSVNIRVKGRDIAEVGLLREELISTMRIIRGLKGYEENDFSINEMSQLLDMYASQTKNIYLAMVLIGALSLLVGGVGVMNIMLVSVTERTREIGVRKALGARRHDILIQFLIEALVLCWIGGVIGIILGFLIPFLVSAVTEFPFAISIKAVAVGFLFTTGVAIFFGIYPAAKAAKKDPIYALRYE